MLRPCCIRDAAANCFAFSRIPTTNRPCIRGTRPSLRCRAAARPARSRSCASRDRRPAQSLSALAGKMPAPRHATRALLHGPGQRPIDDAVVLWFPGPASATGEDVAEFHVHGGRAVLAALFAALSVVRECARRRARRIHAPRLRERQARSHRSRRSRRSHSRRHRSPAPPGAAPAARVCSATRRATGARRSSKRRR